jgi:alginate O-acetyltransferase complex protein AlgI
MLFSSIPFLYYFLPVVMIVYFLVPFKLKNSVLLLASLFFYGWGEPKYIFLMIATIAAFYGCGLLIERAKTKKWKKIWLAVSVVSSLAILCVFKYADFFITNINVLTGLNMNLLKLALPVGISFYTFQCLSYTIDVYRGDVEAQKNPINFGAYVALFPQLIAGPIVRYVDVARELNHRTHSWEGFALGMRRFLIGLAKKIIIANQLGELVSIFRDCGEKSVLFYWVYAIAFMLHIYFDFSGYSDMAIGLGKIFGFNFIENFNYPYMSKSIAEFWRRWHMSLGSWFRDYVYIPLGGNRVSKVRWVFNTLVVWMLTGLWHGAAWNFVLWGLLYAAFLLVEKFVPAIKKLPNFVKRAYTLFLVMIGFVLFNAVDLNQAVSDVVGLFSFASVPFVNDVTLYYLRSYLFVLITAIVGSTPLIKTAVTSFANKETKLGTVVAVLEPVFMFVLLVVCSAYLIDGSFNPFLYFRF